MKEFINKIDSFIEKNNRKIIVGILLIQLFFLVVLLLNNGVFYAVDSDSYIYPALSFIKDGTMCDNSGPTLVRTPGYILLLSLIYFLTNNNDYVVVILQFIMVLANTYMIYYLISQISKKKSLGCIGSLFYICDFAMYQYATSIMTDTLFSHLLVLSFLFAYKFINTKQYKYSLFCFLCLNYALAVRPQILYLNLILNVVLLVLVIFKKIEFKVFLTYVLLFCLIFVGWSYRNYVQFDRYSYTPIRDRDYFMYYAPYTYNRVNGGGIDAAKQLFYDNLYKDYPEFDSLTAMEQVDIMANIGKTYVSENFVAFITCNITGLFEEMIAPNRAAIYKLNIPEIFKLLISLFCGGMLLLSYLIYAFSFLRTLTKQTWFDWMILLIVMYLMASTAIVGYSRYRLAFYPLCLIGTFTCFKTKIKL